MRFRIIECRLVKKARKWSALLFRREDKLKRSFSPLYLAVLSGIILAILIINGLLEINRTKKGFYLLLEREATVHLQHLEKSIQDTLESLRLMDKAPGTRPLNPSLSGLIFSLEESIAEYLVEMAYRVDQIDGETSLTSSEYKALTDRYGVTSVEIFDPEGRYLRGWPSPPHAPQRQILLRDLIQQKRSVVIDLFGKPLGDERAWFSVGILRRVIPGIVTIHLDRERMKALLRQVAIQRVVSDIGPGENILFISVLDGQFRMLAHEGSISFETKGEDAFLREVLQSPHAVSRVYRPAQGEDLFVVAKAFSLGGQPAGCILIGYSSKDIRPVLGHIRKNVALSVLFFLFFGIAAVTLIWVNQNRNLLKMKAMEDRVQLAERLSSLGHLAAGVAHEIRNPLNAIGMGLQRLKREFLPPEPSEKEEYLSFTELILKEIRRVNEIVEQFLTLSRPFKLDLKPSSLQELLNHLKTLFQEEASSHGITLQVQMNSGLPLVSMDMDRLTQAFINIMKNGMQSMERGGILRIETHPHRDRMEVIISDTGAGIPPEQMDKIFNYYYTTKEGGVGLGLPIAHRIIEAHGGQLKVESRVGSGTRVTVTLPLGGKRTLEA
jgi:signal transduction histidine kinase